MYDKPPMQPALYPYDVVSLFQNSQFTKDLAELSMLLTATSYGDITDEADETVTDEQYIGYSIADEKLQEFNTRYFGLRFLNRPTHVTATQLLENEIKSSRDDVSVTTFDARFIGTIPTQYFTDQLVDRENALYVQGMGYYGLSLALLDAKNDLVLVPLSRQNVLACTIDAPQPCDTIMETTETFLAGAELFHNVIASDRLYELDCATQNLQLQETVNELNMTVPGLTKPGELFTVTTLSDDGHAVDTHTGTITAYYPEITEYVSCAQDLPGGEHLFLQIRSGAEIAHTAAPNVLQISHVPTNIQEVYGNVEVYDVLQKFFKNSNVLEAINDIENSLNYGGIDTDDENALADIRGDLMDLWPDCDEYNSIVTGEIYCEIETDKFKPYPINTTDAQISGFDVRKIDDTWRVVMCFSAHINDIAGYEAIDGCDEADCYIVPNDPNVTTFSAYK